MIQAHIYYFGRWEPNLTAFLERRLLPGDTFIDVGANIGYFSLLGSHLVGDQGRVVAIEASPSIFRQLTANLQRNSRTNLRAMNVAASDRYGTVDLYWGLKGNQGASSTVNKADRVKEATVAAAPFDEILMPLEIAAARIIKIDIEGAEPPVLERVLTRLPDFRQNIEIIVEISPAGPSKSSPSDLVGRFRDAGFFCYRLTNVFSIDRYLGRIEPERPRRLATAIGEPEDVIFSRQEAEFL